MKKKSGIVADPPYLDEEERELIESLLTEEWKSVANEKEQIAMLREAAREHRLRKDRRINIRVPDMVVDKIQMRAAKEGLPYQTLISSVLYKFADGQYDNLPR
jgi:predicted DNA binding CopG/RHH family protein